MKTPISHPDSFQQTGKQPIILFALSLIFALSILLPDKCLAQGKEMYVEISEDGETLTFYFDENSGEKTTTTTYGIDEKIGVYPKWLNVVEVNTNYWETRENSYTTVKFDASFADARPTTCAHWFCNSVNLTKIEGIENLHTDDVTDMQCMFDACKSLTELDLSNFYTPKLENMYAMFGSCESLIRIDLSRFNTERVLNMSWLFADCQSLETITFGDNFNTSKVKDMSWMFHFCQSLKSIDVSGFDTKEVTNMFDMFGGCQSLTSLDVSSFNTSKVTDMCGMFNSCINLQELTFGSEFTTNKVTTMESMFYNCQLLKEIDLSIFTNTSALENISSMFSNCINLTSVDISIFNTDNVKEMRGLFSGCEKLQNLDLRNFNTQNVTDMRGMFERCIKLTTILVSNTWKIDNLSNNFDGDHIPDYNAHIFSGCENLIGNSGAQYNNEISANDNYNNYHQDINYANANDGYLTKDSYKIFYDADGNGIIDDNDNNVSWENGEHPQTNILSNTTITQKPIIDGKVFLGWKVKPSTESDNNPQKTIEIPEGAVGNRIYSAVWGEPYVVIDNGTMTFYCKDSENKPENALRIQEFWNYPEWTDEVRKSVTKAVFDDSFKDYKPTNCGYWFYELINLTDISGMKENLNTSDVKDMGFMFYNCKSLSSIDLSSFQTGNVTNMNNMFSGCKNLTTIDVTSFNTENVKTMAGLFQSCSGLTTIDVHNFNTANVLDMFDWCNYCDNLKVLDLRSFETNNNTDIRNMFCHDVSLTTIIVSPDKWKSVKTSSFENTDIIPENPFIDTPQLIGDKGTGYSENSGLSYAHIDGGASNPGYFTTESYKVFYDLDGDGKIDDITTVDWDGATPPTSFALDGTQEVPIPNPISKKGLKFKGWKGTPITGLTEDNLQKDISIPAGAVGNRIYTAMWGEMYTVKFIIDGEEQTDLEVIVEPNSKISAPTVSSKPKYTFNGWYTDEACTQEWNFDTDEVSEDITLYAVWTPKDITITIPEKIIYPAIPQENDAACNGSEKYAVLRFPLPEDVNVTKYELSIPDLITADGTPEITDTGCEINIPISADKTPGRYFGNIKLYIDQNPIAKEYPLTIEVAVARNVLLHLYSDVIFVDNSSGLFGKNGTYQWYHNDQEIPNATNQYLYDPKMSGVYKAKMYTTDGLEVYSCPIDEGKGLSKNSKLQVKTYPNPVVAGNEFTLEVAEYDPSANYTIHISNSNGVVVKEIANAAQFNTLTLNRGIYSGSITSGGRKQGFKLIVK